MEWEVIRGLPLRMTFSNMTVHQPLSISTFRTSLPEGLPLIRTGQGKDTSLPACMKAKRLVNHKVTHISLPEPALAITHLIMLHPKPYQKNLAVHPGLHPRRRAVFMIEQTENVKNANDDGIDAGIKSKKPKT